jgi:hypothetical protein
VAPLAGQENSAVNTLLARSAAAIGGASSQSSRMPWSGATTSNARPGTRSAITCQ